MLAYILAIAIALASVVLFFSEFLPPSYIVRMISCGVGWDYSMA